MTAAEIFNSNITFLVLLGAGFSFVYFASNRLPWEKKRSSRKKKEA